MLQPIVVDADIVFAAFLRDGATRELILDRDLDLRCPSWLWDEVIARYDWLLIKSRLSRPALDELLRQLRQRIVDIPEGVIVAQREEALRRVGRTGRKDAPYVAAVLAIGGVLWTHDARLARAAFVETITTAQLLMLLKT